jgi:alpha-methylacyl-CoA racemase
VPLNLIGDFGGGSMFLAVGVLAALFEARRTGKGQVVDAAIVDGAALLGTMFHGLLAGGFWKDAREVNELDGGSPWYDCYQTSDGKSVSVGAIEGKFYDQLVQRLGFARNELPDRSRRSNYPALRQALADRIASKTLAEWTAIMDGSDACFAPVLNWGELVNHPHNADRNAYLEIDGITHPAPAPRFDRSAPATPGKPSRPGDSTRAVLRNAGLDDRAIDALAASGTVAARD